jgi:ParB family chromosome partitioning protein
MEKDRRNKEEALNNVIDETKKLIRDTDIPPLEITQFEDALMCFVMLEHLDKRHYDYFGIIEGQVMSEDVRLSLYTKLTGEQKNILKRDFLIKNMLRISGISKRTALLIELAKLHFSDALAVIEHTHSEEYLKKRQVIQNQIDKINSENEELKEVA